MTSLATPGLVLVFLAASVATWIAGVALSRTWEGARTFLIGGGFVYLVLFVYGAIFHSEKGSNWIPVNWADNVLHLALGAGMIVLGLALGKEKIRRDTPVAAT